MFIKRIDDTCMGVYACDWCGVEFTRRIENVSKTHGCCRSHGSKASRKTVKQNLLAKHGVINVSQLASVRAQVKQTCLERYGVEHAWQSEQTRKHSRETLMQNYGVEHPLQSSVIVARMKDANLVKYGVEHPWELSEVRAKSQQTMVELYGVDHPMKSPDIRQRAIDTNVERYGVENPMQRSDIKDQAKVTNLIRYGVENVYQRPDVRERATSTEARVKAHLTMKRNGTYGKSKPEDRLYEVLCELFGTDDVERQATVGRWPIDFYVKSIDTYVQYDSYWHGVGRDINEVAEHKTKRDVHIHAKMLTDIAQREHFDAHVMHLVRVQGLSLDELTAARVSELVCPMRYIEGNEREGD